MRGPSGSETWPVLTSSHRIASSSPENVAGMGGGCGSVGVWVSSVLDTSRLFRLAISFLSSSS